MAGERHLLQVCLGLLCLRENSAGSILTVQSSLSCSLFKHFHRYASIILSPPVSNYQIIKRGKSSKTPSKIPPTPTPFSLLLKPNSFHPFCLHQLAPRTGDFYVLVNRTHPCRPDPIFDRLPRTGITAYGRLVVEVEMSRTVLA